MSEDDVLFGYRLRVFDHAARTSVSEACRVFGIHRSTFYVWKRRAERHGLEILRPRERRRPRMPQQLSPFVEERIVAFALGHPGYGPRRIASELRAGALGRDRRQPQRRLALPAPARPQHARQAALAGRRLRSAVRAAARAAAGAARRGGAAGRAGRDRLLLRRPALRHEGLGLAADRDRRRLLLRLGRAGQLPAGQPDRRADLQARPPRLRRPRPGGLAARARALRQRRRVPLPRLPHHARRSSASGTR